MNGRELIKEARGAFLAADNEYIDTRWNILISNSALEPDTAHLLLKRLVEITDPTPHSIRINGVVFQPYYQATLEHIFQKLGVELEIPSESLLNFPGFKQPEVLKNDDYMDIPDKVRKTAISMLYDWEKAGWMKGSFDESSVPVLMWGITGDSGKAFGEKPDLLVVGVDRADFLHEKSEEIIKTIRKRAILGMFGFNSERETDYYEISPDRLNLLFNVIYLASRFNNMQVDTYKLALVYACAESLVVNSDIFNAVGSVDDAIFKIVLDYYDEKKQNRNKVEFKTKGLEKSIKYSDLGGCLHAYRNPDESLLFQYRSQVLREGGNLPPRIIDLISGDVITSEKRLVWEIFLTSEEKSYKTDFWVGYLSVGRTMPRDVFTVTDKETGEVYEFPHNIRYVGLKTELERIKGRPVIAEV